MSYYLYPDYIIRNDSTPSKVYNQILNRTEPNSKPLKCYDKWVSDAIQGLIDSDDVMFGTRALKVETITSYLTEKPRNGRSGSGSIALIDYDLAIKFAKENGKTLFIKKLDLYSVDAFAIQHLLLDNDKLNPLHRKLFIDDIITTL